MEVYQFEGLICTDLKLIYRKRAKILHNVVIDTGAAQTIINSRFVEDIGLYPGKKDLIGITRGIGGEIKFFHKVVDSLIIGNFRFKDIRLDFANIDPKAEIQGLLGLDILKTTRSVIDVEIPVIYQKGM